MEDALTVLERNEAQAPSAPVDLELLNALVENSPDPMLLLEPDGSILYANQAMCNLVGRTKQCLTLKGRNIYLDPEDARWFLYLESKKKTKSFKGELTLTHKDGSTIPVEIKASAFTNSLGLLYNSVHLRDLRPELAAKEQLLVQKQSLETALIDLQLVMDHTTDMVCVFDFAGTILQVNKASMTVLGYAPEEMIGRNFLQFIHPDDAALTALDSENVQTKYVSNNFRNRYVHKDGSTVYLSWSSALFLEKKNVYCIARNISELVTYEKLQQKSDSRMQALLSHGSDMIAIFSPEGNYIFASANTERILGLAVEDFIGKDVFDFIHPEDKPHVLEAFATVLKGGSVESKLFRFKTGCGDWRWLETTATNCLHDPNINGILTNSRDVTDKRLTGLRLQESEVRYKALFDYNPDAVYAIDTDGYYISGNKVTLELFGLTAEELKEKHYFEFANPADLEKIKDEFRRVMAGESISGESTLTCKDNKQRYFNYTEIPIIINGEVIGAYGIAKDITESKHQQQLLANTAKRLKNILESIKDAFFTIDKGWRFTYVNHEFERALGVAAKDVAGSDMRDMFPPLLHGSFYQHCHRALAEKQPMHFEEFADALQMWLDISVFPSEEGLSISIRGINARKKAEEELKKLSLVASKTVNSVYITDHNACIEWVNDGFTRITGYVLEEVIGRKPGDFLASPATISNVSSIREKLAFNTPFVQEVQNISKSGEVYWSKLDVTPIVDEHSGGVKKFIVIETVITEQKKAEEERAQLTEELMRRNRHLEQFTYIVSHNLRSPVANILGLTSLLDTVETPEMREGLTYRLQKSAHNLDTIIRDLNDLLSLPAGMLETKETVFLPEVVEEVLQVLPPDSYREVDVNLNGIYEIGSVRSYLSSILSNLLTNAVKYQSPERPLHIKISAEWKEDSNHLCLLVSDNGLGINLEKEGKNMFGLYKRFHFHVPGRGLGLYLVKTQVEALGGHVSVESTPGVGSTFKICLLKVD